MKSDVLITRPAYDYTTRYISAWAQKILDFAKERSKKVIDLSRERANRQEFESVIVKKDPSLILLNGHGGENYVMGHDGEILIAAEENHKLLKDKIVYALSCRSAKKLGPASIKGGTRAYVGYDEDFIFMYTIEKRTLPLEDRTAALFLEPSNQFAISLLKGNSVGASFESAKKLYIKNIQKFLTSQTSFEDRSAVRYLLWDLRHFVSLGDQEATV